MGNAASADDGGAAADNLRIVRASIGLCSEVDPLERTVCPVGEDPCVRPRFTSSQDLALGADTQVCPYRYRHRVPGFLRN